jgi:cytochrome c biogenesis protein CcmG, thiol:disulfide interchange protein DsbE
MPAETETDVPARRPESPAASTVPAGEGASKPPRRAAARAIQAIALLAALGFIALLVYGLAAKAPDATIDESLSRAQAVPAPGFDLPVLQEGELGGELSGRLEGALADGRLSLDELEGAPVVLNFWASWCLPCREEAPLLERSWRAARADGVVLVGLNMQDLTGDARAFMREFGNSYPNVRDQSNGVARNWGVTGLPETFFVTAGGDIVGHVIGVVSEEQLRQGIAAARSGRPVGAAQGGAQRPTD